MNRAYGLLEFKAVDEDQRIIEGIASTITVDRQGDIVVPKGAQYKLPLPLLWQHRSSEPVGNVTAVKISGEAITIKAQLAKVDEPGKLKDRLDEAWGCLKAGLVRGLSIGFTPIESAQIKDTYSYKFNVWEWLELSLVTIPAQSEANITAIKSIDRQYLPRPKGIVRLSDKIEVVKEIQKSKVPMSERKPGIVYL